MLIKYHAELRTPEAIDSIVNAELPADPELRELVLKFMYHHHPYDRVTKERTIPDYCGRTATDGTRYCRFGYPKPLQDHTTIDDEGRVHYRRRNPGDEWVVPHNIALILAMQCHINMEVSNTTWVFQYLFKYILKKMAS